MSNAADLGRSESPVRKAWVESLRLGHVIVDSAEKAGLADTSPQYVVADTGTAGAALAIVLPSPVGNDGLGFTIIQRGSIHATTITAAGEDADDADSFEHVLTQDGATVTVLSDGETWQIVWPVPPTVWDVASASLVPARDPEAVTDSVYALLRSLITVVRDEGINVPIDLELFHEHSQR